MGYLYNYFFLVVFVIGVAIVFFASEFGWRLGIRTDGQAASGNISALEQSLLGLLALIVGFTFLMALTRFEAPDMALHRANRRFVPDLDILARALLRSCISTGPSYP